MHHSKLADAVHEDETLGPQGGQSNFENRIEDKAKLGNDDDQFCVYSHISCFHIKIKKQLLV